MDLFAGTGNLGIEAFSRGAASVTAVEMHPKSVEIIKKNIQALGIEDEILLIKKDVFRFLAAAPEQPYHLIFVDPPFTEVLADKVMTALAGGEFLTEDGWIAIESAKKELIQDSYGCLALQDRRFYGDKTLSLYRKRPMQGEVDEK